MERKEIIDIIEDETLTDEQKISYIVDYIKADIIKEKKTN